MKAVTRAVALTIATTAVVALGSTGTAHALQRTCAVNGAYWWLPDTCHTYSVAANPSGHFVDIGIWPYRGCQFSWKVRDIANNVVVRAGQTGNHNERIHGLYGYYKLEATKVGTGCGGDVSIDNT
ncbi:hypothetical protein ACIOWI_24525 [Streptomyces sp. NPDC087659]|uniref:hypothetical protein n=1 Tax=unclassified Streptomyces TaxID=2593676 RepID=UPI0030142234